MIHFFSKKETLIITCILTVIFIISFFNYQTALRRGRDNARENDLSDIAKVLEAFHEENSIYPSSINDPELKKYGHVPEDPGTEKGFSYLYLSDGKYYQIYASLEGGSDESLYDINIERLNLKCGKYTCNFGKATGNIPLDKSIEEYENEIKLNEKK